MIKKVYTSAAPEAIGPYSQAPNNNFLKYIKVKLFQNYYSL